MKWFVCILLVCCVFAPYVRAADPFAFDPKKRSDFGDKKSSNLNKSFDGLNKNFGSPQSDYFKKNFNSENSTFGEKKFSPKEANGFDLKNAFGAKRLEMMGNHSFAADKTFETKEFYDSTERYEAWNKNSTMSTKRYEGDLPKKVHDVTELMRAETREAASKEGILSQEQISGILNKNR